MDMEVKQIAEGVFACVQQDKGWCYDNTVYIAWGDGLLVDTMFDLPHNRRMIELFRDLGPWPPRYVVNTHHDGDHTFGNQLFPDSEIIGHRLCPAEMERECRPEQYHDLINPPDDAPDWLLYVSPDWQEWDLTGVVMTPPNSLMDDRRKLELDGKTVDIIYVGPAHSQGDMIVHLPKPGIVITGDLCFHQNTPIAWAGPYQSIMHAFDLIQSLEFNIVVPGHGPLCGPEAIAQDRAYYELVYQEAKKGFDKGLSPLEAAKQVHLPKPYCEWMLPARLVLNFHRFYLEFAAEEGESRDATGIMEDFYALIMHWQKRDKS